MIVGFPEFATRQQYAKSRKNGTKENDLGKQMEGTSPSSSVVVGCHWG